MTKRRLISLSFLAVFLVGGYLAADKALAYTAQTVLRMAEDKLPPTITLTHGALTTSLWRMQVVLHDVTITVPEETIKADTITASGFPWYWDGRVSIGQLTVAKATLSGATTGSLASLQLNRPGLTLDYPHSFTFRSGSLQQALGATSSFQEAKLGAFNGTRLSHFEALGFESHQPDALGIPLEVKIASLKLDNPNLPLLQESEPQVLMMRLLLQDSLRGLVIENMTVTRQAQEGLHLNRLEIDGHQTSGIARTALGVTVDGLKIARFALPPDVQNQLTTLGQESLEFKGEFSSKLEPEKRKLVFSPAHLTIPNMLDISVKGEISNVQNAQQIANGVAMAEAGVQAIELRVRDLGYIKRRVEDQALLRGVSREAYIAREMENVPMLNGTGASLDRFRKALTEFGLNSGELVIVARPSRPVSLLRLVFLAKRPNDLLQTLGVFATVNAQSQDTAP